ncbi:hypothetical protein OBJ98_11525 [Empedobacter falsenii]
MTKQEFEKNIIVWLYKHLSLKYKEYNVEVIKPTSNISKLNIDKIKKNPGYTSFDFKPDILVILENKKNYKIELVIVNRTINAISLKEIGEINLFSRITNSIESYILSLKGLPEEVNLILMNSDLEKDLLNYNDGKQIYLLRWDQFTNKIESKAIYPSKLKDEFI